MFDCLQQPVPDQALRLGDQGVERIGTRQCCVRLTLERQDTDLRAVAVGDDDAVLRDERSQGLRGTPDVMLLDVGVRLFATLEQGVATQGNHDPHGCVTARGSSKVATMIALIVCRRFSA